MSNVRPIGRLAESTQIVAAADAIRDCDLADPDSLADDLADLLAAVGAVMRSTGHPPLGETEQWRWSRVVMVSRRIARTWVPR